MIQISSPISILCSIYNMRGIECIGVSVGTIKLFFLPVLEYILIYMEDFSSVFRDKLTTFY